MNHIKIPAPNTLRKYGLSKDDYISLYPKDGKCPICKREFNDDVVPVVDHEHLERYKNKSPEFKRLHIRGLTCRYCNFRVINKNITLDRARNIVNYLQKYTDKIMDEEQL